MGLLHVIESGSNGNGYVITSGNDRLILECGCKHDKYLKALDYDLSNVHALVTHKHKDHSRYIPQIAKLVPVYSSFDVAAMYSESNVKIIKPMKRYQLGNFNVMPLEVPHGDCNNMAFVIDHNDIGRLVFATDLTSFRYNIKDVNHILIECNYVDEIVLQNYCDNKDVRSAFDTHMELSETIASIKRMKSPVLQNIILCHLSKGNSDYELMTKRIKDELNFHAEIANSGKIFKLNEYDF